MDHLLLKAATTATDQGTFEAVVSTVSTDREGDIVEPSAMAKALAKWVKVGKLVPLAWNHTEEVIGHIDPASVRIDNKREVVVKGQIDQTTDRGPEAWRLVKSGTLSFSFGYLVPDGGATKRTGKQQGYHITELDLFEISVVPIAPANNDTRVLSFKSADLRRLADEVEREESARAVEQAADVIDEAAIKALADLEATEQAKAAAQAEADKPPVPQDQAALDHQAAGVERTEAERKLAEVTKAAGTPEVDDIAAKIERAKEALEAQELFEPEEIAGLKGGILKAVWSAAFINDLPDSAFLYIEPGGDKDADGRTTPRSLRHFPYKDDTGAVDLPHLRNALARIPQSSLSQDIKDRLTTKAQRILDNSKSVPVVTADVTDKEAKPRSVDPLRKQAESTALEFASGGLSLREPPKKVAQPKPEPELELADLKRRTREEMLTHLSGDIT